MRAVLIAILLCMMDGFDVLVMGFVAPYLARDWGLSPSEVGYALTAGVAGMGVGSAFISPLADKIGRRPHINIMLALITVGMVMTGLAPNLTLLIAFRFFAGLFIGGLITSLNIIVSEYSSDKRRGTIMGIYGIGLPLGASLGGLASNWIIANYNWHGPFFFGAILSALLLIVSWLWLPESITYLIEKRPKGALEKYNAIGAKMGQPPAAELPAPLASGAQRNVAKAIFSGIMAPRTSYLWIAYGLLTAAFYFANTWTGRLIGQALNDPAAGTRAQSFVPLGGVLGALVFAGLCLFLHTRLATAAICFGGTITYLIFAANFSNASLGLLLAFSVGIFANGGIAAFYAVSPNVYPAAVRAGAMGLMLGFGRIVSITAPLLSGWLLEAGWQPPSLYSLFGWVLAVSGVLMILMHLTYRGRSENPDTPYASAEDDRIALEEAAAAQKA
ncbi:MAG: MFS transporter [Dermatophilus congolensis]|nr:MFS transporter [Dermatophilus congolensis]